MGHLRALALPYDESDELGSPDRVGKSYFCQNGLEKRPTSKSDIVSSVPAPRRKLLWSVVAALLKL